MISIPHSIWKDTMTKQTLITLTLILFSLLSASAEAQPLTVNEAVRMALSTDLRIDSTLFDLEGSRTRLKIAEQNRYPSLSLSGVYTRLSEVNSSIELGASTIPIPSQTDAFSLAANLQYPVFAGFRLREAVNLAALDVRGKEISIQRIRNSVIFETRRAYWEAVRADHNASMLRENLSLMEHSRDVISEKFTQGTVLRADLLAAEMRRNQAEMDLGSALARREKAYLALQMLITSPEAAPAEEENGDRHNLPFTLASDPAEPGLSDRAEEIRKKNAAGAAAAASSAPPGA